MLVVAVLWVAFFLINFNVAMMIPLLPFVQRTIGLSAYQAGLVLAAFPIVALLSNLALGPWIDRFGRKPFIVAGSTGCAAILLATAAADDATALILCRAATGIFMPMVGASIFAAIADYVAATERAWVSGLVTTAAPIAFLLSISMGFFLGALFSWRLPLILLAAIAGALALAAARLPPTPGGALSDRAVSIRSYQRRLLSVSLDAEARRLFIAYFSWSMAIYTLLGLYPTWIVQHGLVGYGASTIGAMLLVGEVGGLLGAACSGRLAKLHAHPFGACAVAAFAMAALIPLIPVADGIFGLQMLVYGGFAFGRDMMHALILGGAMLLVPAAEGGSLNALLNATYQMGASAGGLASAWLYASSPGFSANAVAASLLLFASGASLRSIRPPGRTTDSRLRPSIRAPTRYLGSPGSE